MGVKPKKNKPEARPIAPYAALARIYDQVMAQIDYPRWANLSAELLTGAGLPPQARGRASRLLECACGTGTLALLLAGRGYEVEGRDQSPEMIAAAEDKARSLPQNPPRFRVEAFSELAAENACDALICLYDSLNYLLETPAVMDFMERVNRALVPGGLFLLDICTALNSRLHFHGREEEDRGNGFRYRRKMQFYEDEQLQENLFEIEFDDQPGTVWLECHRQRIYPLHHIHHCLTRTGHRVLRMTDGFTLNPPHPESLRVHLLCRRS